MIGFFIVVHALMCFILIAIILAQSGRGGGLTDGFAAAESVFGAKTNEFMVKATAIAGIVFLVTSLSLAHLSSRAERSLMDGQTVDGIPEVVETMPEFPEDVTSPEADSIYDIETPNVPVETSREVVR